MSAPRIVIIGTSFGGYTAAIDLRDHLKTPEEAHITVVAPSPDFVFIPSLIWYPFGIRSAEQISFDVRPIYQKKHIEFVLEAATRFDLDRKVVVTDTKEIPYDYLIIATGPKVDFESVKGLGPHAHSYSICNIPHAEEAKKGWEKLLANPGPIVIGAAQGAACFGAAYEFLFNVRYQLKKHHLLDEVPIHFVTAEPFLGHFGIGGFGNAQQMSEKLFKWYNIDWHVNSTVEEVTADSVKLGDGTVLPSHFTMIIPRFLGVDAVRNSTGLANANGFIETNAYYQHPKYPEVYAAGVAVHVPPPGETPIPCGVPKTGHPTEMMAKTAVHNILVEITGKGKKKTLPFGEIEAYCIMDTGNMGMIIVGDHMLGDRHLEFIVPGPQAHWAKLAFEKYFLWSRSHGHV